MLYHIPLDRAKKLRKKLEFLNCRAIKNNVETIPFSFSAPYDKVVNDVEGEKVLTFTDLELNVDMFRPIDGFIFLASVEHSPNGNILINKNPDISIPEEYRISGNHCDHCNVDRYRKNTYILYNEVTKEYIQVGSTCIKDFLGFNVSLISSRFEILDDIKDICSGPFFGGQLVSNLKTFLAIVNVLIDLNGYISSKTLFSKGDNTLITTGHDAFNVSTSNDEYSREIRMKVTSEHYDNVDKAIDWFKKQDTSKDYFYNVSTIIKNEYVTKRISNLAASIMAVYFKEVSKEKETKISSEYIGTVGEKIQIEVKVINIQSIESRYGMIHIYRMVTSEGNIVVWFTSTSKLELDKKYRGLVKIKKHDEYKNIKQTVITRPSFKEIF